MLLRNARGNRRGHDERLQLGSERVRAEGSTTCRRSSVLGYNPLPEPKTLAERLVQHRRVLGMSQTELASKLGVDPGTLARWERGEREPTGALMGSVKHFLRGTEASRTTCTAGVAAILCPL